MYIVDYKIADESGSFMSVSEEKITMEVNWHQIYAWMHSKITMFFLSESESTLFNSPQ